VCRADAWIDTFTPRGPRWFCTRGSFIPLPFDFDRFDGRRRFASATAPL
jgi:hypothetical protein